MKYRKARVRYMDRANEVGVFRQLKADMHNDSVSQEYILYTGNGDNGRKKMESGKCFECSYPLA